MATAMFLLFLVVLFCCSVVNIYLVFAFWIPWCVLRLEGAGRKIFVGVHAILDMGFVKPDPRGSDTTTVIVSPLTVIQALVDPDIDEVDIVVPVQPEGAPASSSDAKDQVLLHLQVPWSIRDVTPFVDDPGAPGDHGKIPRNLLIPADQVRPEVREYFTRIGWEKHFGSITHYVPAAAVIALVNRYAEGEHLLRVYRTMSPQARGLAGILHVNEFIRLKGSSKGPPVIQKLPFTGAMIRGRWVAMSTDMSQPDYIPPYYSNLAELYQLIGRILTWLARLELEPYGVFINSVTVLRLTIPQRLVDASREREARVQEAKGVPKKTRAIGKGAKAIMDEVPGADETVAVLVSGEAAEQNPLLGWVKAGLDTLKTTLGRGK